MVREIYKVYGYFGEPTSFKLDLRLASRKSEKYFEDAVVAKTKAVFFLVSLTCGRV